MKMKKLPLILVLMLTAVLPVLAQPVFEHKYSESATICQLEILGEVYYSMDVVNRQFLVYSMDHNLLKSVPLPTPEGYYLADIQYVSEHLFNDDDLLELVYIYSKYVPIETSYYYTFESRVINENGTVILSLPGVGFTQVLETEAHGVKLLAYEYNYSVIPYLTFTHVYGLPGQINKAAEKQLFSSDQGYAYPNPATRQVNIPVSLPEGVEKGSLEIMDLRGRLLLSYPLAPSISNVIVPARQLVPGTYLYRVNAGNRPSDTGKMVIQ
jgi:hypothetical protein